MVPVPRRRPNVSDYNPTQRLHVLERSGTDPMGPYTFKADLGNDWQLDASVLRVGGTARASR